MGGYVEALGYLYGLAPRGIRLELDRMRAALALRGDPQRGLRVIHVAGTNGKGSVAAVIESALRRAGLETGLYTSPHLHRFTERIRVGGRAVTEREVARTVRSIRETLDRPGAPPLTFFETTTLLAFELFRARGCELVVLEVGLGGRLDSTNVVEGRELCVITRLALEHTDRLGDTLGAIAGEKAGILESGVPAVVGVREPEAREVIDHRARELGAPVRWIDRDFGVEARERAKPGRGRGTGRLTVRVGDRRLEGLRVPFAGAHQQDNVALAVASLCTLAEVRGVPVQEAAIREGLERCRWPGRLERIGGAPPVLLDAAHNPDACAALGAHLDELPRSRRVLVFGAMADKDHEGMLAAFDGRVDRRLYTAPRLDRAAAPAALARVRPGQTARDVPAAVDRARRLAGEDGLVVVAGSIFAMAEARAHLLGVRTDPPIAM
ncbi:MAG: bifunctional folylpolyglutamate synthase/dihydrofolate synthase [Myxococcota bacterium]